MNHPIYVIMTTMTSKFDLLYVFNLGKFYVLFDFNCIKVHVLFCVNFYLYKHTRLIIDRICIKKCYSEMFVTIYCIDV